MAAPRYMGDAAEHVLGELAGQERRDRAAREADEAVGRGGDRALDDGGTASRLRSTPVLTIPSSAPETTITTISPACDAWNTPPREQVDRDQRQSVTPSTATSQYRRSSRCAPNTDVSATSRPQPK